MGTLRARARSLPDIETMAVTEFNCYNKISYWVNLQSRMPKRIQLLQISVNLSASLTTIIVINK